MLRGPYLYPTATERFVVEYPGFGSDHSRRSWSKILRMLQARYPVKRVNEFTKDDLITFLKFTEAGEPHTLAPRTIASRRTCIQSFFIWAHDIGLVRADPASTLRLHVRVKDRSVRTHHWLTEDEVTALARELDGETDRHWRDRIAIGLGLYLGMRASEVCGLLWDNVNFGRRQISFVGKGNKLGQLDVPPQLITLLFSWRSRYMQALEQADDLVRMPVVVRLRAGFGANGQPRLATEWGAPLGPNGFNELVHTRGGAVGLPGLAPHDLRRSFAGILQNNGTPLEVISKLLRHENIGTTVRYLENNPARAAEAHMAAFANIAL